MKKAISLLLALIICLSVCACGDDSRENSVPSSSNAEPVEEATFMPQIEGYQETLDKLPCFFGEWRVFNRTDVGKMETLIFREDGTVSIGEESLTWALTHVSPPVIYVDLFAGEEKVGYLSLTQEDRGDISASLFRDDGGIGLYKPSHYEIITVTEENVHEYFELKDHWVEERNGFGELEWITITTNFQIKEPYLSRVSQLMMNDSRDDNIVDTGVIEMSYEVGDYDVILNLEDQTYTVENVTYRETKTFIDNITCWDPESIGFYFRSLIFAPNETESIEVTGNNYHMDVLRIKMDLYLIAEP